MAYPRMEGRITVATAGHVFSFTEQTGPVTDAAITIAAGDYYFADYLTALQTALNASATLNNTYAVSCSMTTDGATGIVTIERTAGASTFTASLTSTVGRDIMGFASGTLSPAATTFSGTEHAEYLFLPNVGRTAPMAPDGARGTPVSDGTLTVSPMGTTKAMGGAVRYIDRLEFMYLVGSKSFVSLEATANESLECFWLKVISQGQPFRYYKDRSVASYVAYRASLMTELGARSLNNIWGARGLFAWASDVVEYV